MIEQIEYIGPDVRSGLAALLYMNDADSIYALHGSNGEYSGFAGEGSRVERLKEGIGKESWGDKEI